VWLARNPATKRWLDTVIAARKDGAAVSMDTLHAEMRQNHGLPDSIRIAAFRKHCAGHGG
jgi:hypothetical protein